MTSASKEQLSSFLACRIEEFAKARNLILYHGGLNFLADLQISVYQTCRRFLENNSLDQLENTLRSNPDHLHANIPVEISEDVLFFLQNQRGVFATVLDVPQYVENKVQKRLELLAAQEKAAKTKAKEEKERVEAMRVKNDQLALAAKLGISGETLEKLQKGS